MRSNRGRVAAGIALLAGIVNIVAGVLSTVRDAAELTAPSRPTATAPAAHTVTATIAPPGSPGSAAVCEDRSKLWGGTLDPGAPQVTICLSARGAQEKWTGDAGTSSRGLVGIRAAVYNTGNTQLDNVVVKTALPPTLFLIPETTTLLTASNAGGIPLSNDVAGRGLNIGSYAPGANGFVIFYLRTANPDDLPCGPNRAVVTVTVETDYGTRAANSVITTTRYGC